MTTDEAEGFGSLSDDEGKAGSWDVIGVLSSLMVELLKSEYR
jgi:hypothetical protein